MILTHCLSIMANRLASAGSCFMMSPPANTASRYIHVACTSSHSVMFSLTSVSLAIHPWTSSRNGATNREASMDPICSCDSSNNSLVMLVSSPFNTMGPRCLNSPNASSRSSQSAAMAFFLFSISASFTLDRAISSTSSLNRSSLASRMFCNLKRSASNLQVHPEIFMISFQCRSFTAGTASSSNTGCSSKKSSMVCFSSRYASQSRSDLGSFLHWFWYPMTSSVMAAKSSSVQRRSA
mmetsp:Transcript_20779/g.35684  ORF Transcript_20779/g.35684 Transcript_20779/m.35684 type:complete len:238 (-) Transcript_20779:3913-4626(-)